MVLMTQIGSFVPATEARIGIVDGVYTRCVLDAGQGRAGKDARKGPSQGPLVGGWGRLGRQVRAAG